MSFKNKNANENGQDNPAFANNEVNYKPVNYEDIQIEQRASFRPHSATSSKTSASSSSSSVAAEENIAMNDMNSKAINDLQVVNMISIDPDEQAKMEQKLKSKESSSNLISEGDKKGAKNKAKKEGKDVTIFQLVRKQVNQN